MYARFADAAEIAATDITPEEFRREVPPIASWHEWLKRAKLATTLEEKVGLVHCGFEMELDWAPHSFTYTSEDRLAFYFGVADGWNDNGLLRKGGRYADEPSYRHVGWAKDRSSIERSESEQRQVLAKYAFKALVREYFKRWLDARKEDAKYSRDVQHHYNNLFGTKVFDMVQQFFRVEDGLCNFEQWHLHDPEQASPEEQHARAYLLKLPAALWAWEEVEIRSYDKPKEAEQKRACNERTRQTVEAAKVWIVEVLSCLGEIEVLSDLVLNSKSRHFLDLSRACQRKLKEIALNQKISVANGFLPSRPVTSLSEALMIGSPAAVLLTRYLFAKQELRRLMRLQRKDEERQARERAESERLKQIADAEAALATAHATLTALGQHTA